MITCPICNKEVKNYYRGSVPQIATDEDFECPVTVFSDGSSQSHFFRFTVYSPKETYTVAITPPLQFTWYNNQTIVKLIKIEEDDETVYSDLITLPAIPITHNAINELGTRLTKLIPFI